MSLHLCVHQQDVGAEAAAVAAAGAGFDAAMRRIAHLSTDEERSAAWQEYWASAAWVNTAASAATFNVILTAARRWELLFGSPAGAPVPAESLLKHIEKASGLLLAMVSEAAAAMGSYQLLQQPLVLMQAQQRQRVELVVLEPLGPMGRGRSRCKDSACMQQLLGREPGR